MSASREKKKRQEQLAGGTADPKAARAAEEKAAARKTNLLYGIIFGAFIVLAAVLLVYNSGIIQRNQAAVTIDGEKYTVPVAAYFYQQSYQNFLNSQNGYFYTALGMLDTSQPLSSQQYDETRTWADYFKEQAVNNLRFVHAAKKGAAEDNLTLDSEDMETYNAALDSLKSAASQAGYSFKSYLQAMYGPTMTPSILESCMKDQLLATKYANAYSDSLSFTDEEIAAYYDENKNNYDLVDGAYVRISGAAASTTDEDGNTVAPTEEEQAAAMAEAKETAEAILAAYNDGGDLETLASDQGGTYTGSEEMTYTSSVPVEWLFDSARSSGDVELLEDAAASAYYVAVFHSRQRDEALDYNVRHILVTEDSLELAEGEEATDELLEARAQEILDSWDGTEDGFASLANEHSQDPGSNTNGGLYEDVPKGYMVSDFQNWCYESGRRPGDTGIVKSTAGHHIMYFVGYGDTQYWHYACENALIANAESEWQESMIESSEAQVSESGMKSVG